MARLTTGAIEAVGSFCENHAGDDRRIGYLQVAYFEVGYLIPALQDAGLRVVDEPKIVLFSRSGYSAGLRNLAEHDDRIELVDVPAELRADANHE